MKSTLFASLFLFSLISQGQSDQRVNNSFVAFTIPEKDLLPESIAYDSKEKAFYISSTRKGKVIKVDAEGNVTDFITSKKNGLWMTIGMKVDSKRRHLWVCSSGGENLVGYNLKDEIDGRPAGIFKFDLTTGELIKKYTFEKKGEVHFMNDLVIARNGTVFVTHMFNEHSIYRIGSNDKLELLLTSTDIPYPNGLALADNQRTLFVAHSNGISSINLETKSIKALTVPDGENISKRASIDGLYYYKWKLFGVHPSTSTISMMPLNENGDGLKEVKVLERNHPMMMNPTTGVLVANEFYYIANAQFDSFNEDGTLWPMQKLYEPVVLKVKID
ncbi:MAG: SMP-30/gluconolactonase/LRE family protein [Cyclobacteriaceae bacterium]